MENLQKVLDQYVLDQNNADLNFALANEYDRLGSRAAACSYWLRAAELYSGDLDKAKCFIELAWNYYNQGDRMGEMLLHTNYALSYDVLNPKAQTLRCIYYSEKQLWYDLVNHAKMALQLNLREVEYNRYYIDDTIFHFYAGYGLFHLKMYEECSRHFEVVINNSINPVMKRQALQLVDSVGLTVDRLTYTSNKYDNCKFKFSGLENVDRNHSQCMQDMFVLTVTGGKRSGTYLEIGAADPIIHNNTKLLEEFDWKGVSLEINQDECNKFNFIRRNKCLNFDATQIDYKSLIDNQYGGEWIDYLQVDCDPAPISYQILTKIIESGYKFGIVTFEHDRYASGDQVMNQSREFMKNHDYILVHANVGMIAEMAYEDWYIHKDYIHSDYIKYQSDTTTDYTSIDSIFY